MNANIEVTYDATRRAIRECIMDLVKVLQEDHGVELRDIVAELLTVASMSVSDESCKINSGISYSVDFGEDELDETDDEDEDEEEEDDDAEAADDQDWKRFPIFLNSETHKQFQSLLEKQARLEVLGRYDEAIPIMEEVIAMCPAHARKWDEVFGSINNYEQVFSRVADSLMRAYAVLGNKNGIAKTVCIAKELSALIGEQKLDIEIFIQEAGRFLKDVETFKMILRFISSHPNSKQSNLFKELSLEGRKTTYLLEWAAKLNRISRTRHRDTWLLKAA